MPRQDATRSTLESGGVPSESPSPGSRVHGKNIRQTQTENITKYLTHVPQHHQDHRKPREDGTAVTDQGRLREGKQMQGGILDGILEEERELNRKPGEI